MALLRWVHLRKLVPLAELLAGGGGLDGGLPVPRSGAPGGRTGGPSVSLPPRPAPPASGARPPAPAARTPVPPSRPPAGPPAGAAAGPGAPTASAAAPPPSRALLVDDVSEAALARFREAFLAEVKRTRGQADWGMVFMPARRVDVELGSVTFVYEIQPKLMATRFEALKPELSETATRLAGRPMAVGCRVESGAPAPGTPASPAQGEKDKLKAEVMAEPAVQALLDVFPADIRDVEEVKE
jgi:hypothetical protein